MPYFKRKNPRLSGFDYSENGVYFITICTHGRKLLFSNVYSASNSLQTENQLTMYGKIVAYYLESISERFPVIVDNYVIMPNHVHMLIAIHDLERIKAIHESSLHGRSVISKVVGYLKMNVSKQMHLLGYGEEIWQRSYHDHIVRNKWDYDKIWLYIEDNPRRWLEDCFYCDSNYAQIISELP